jgi:hypothetical protein
MRNAQGPLLVNADASRGAIRVEVLGPGGQVVPGYSAADCAEIRTDSLAHRVTWHTAGDLAETREPIQLRFLLTEAALYSFHAGPEVARH